MTERELFEQALEIDDPTERASYLDRACADQPTLRRQVDQLLKAHEQADTFLERPHPAAAMENTGTFSPPSSPVEMAGRVIAGKYKLLQRIGEGGMGSVWMADQLEPVKRRVAVKLIRTERDGSRNILSRFEAERQAIALMDHPHIAKLLDAGSTDGENAGHPFFVMELVKGIALTDFCDEHKLGVPERLKLFIQICSAVQHAHQKGIIHRDLKPTNILVEMHDHNPVPKVIDFGLAKAMSGQPLTEHTLFTGFGTVAGTPLYMAPEQAKFNAIDIDTRADIYALGVILYELLTGSTPIERDQLKKAALDEILRVIREGEPPTPSKRLSSTHSRPSIAANRGTEPLKLGRFVRGELDWIVMKALAKERDRRYETATGFARDVERFLNHEPVIAGPPSAAYRLRKFVQRNRGQVLAASLVVLTLVLGIAGTTFGLIRAEIRRGEAERARANEAEQRRVAQTNEAKANVAAEAEKKAKDREKEQRKKAEKARDRTRQALDAMTSSVAGDSLRTQKEISAEQKKFLAQALTYYKETAAEKGDDEQARFESASMADQVGIIECRLGRTTEAAAAFRQACADFEKLIADFPDAVAYREDLAKCALNLGNMLARMGNWTEADKQFQHVLSIHEKLVVEFPAVLRYRQSLATVRMNLGALTAQLGMRPRAEEQFRKAVAIQEKLAAEFPANAEYRQDLARSLVNLSLLLTDAGTNQEAESQYRKAVAIQEKLTMDFPDSPVYGEDLARSENSLGLLLSETGKRPEAEELFRKAIAIQQKLVGRFPAAPEYREELARTRNSLGMLLNDLRKWPEAEEEIQKAVAIQEKLVVEFPSAPEYQHELGSSHNNLGLIAYVSKRPGAEEQYRKALTIKQKLAAEFPAVPQFQIELSGSCCNFGRLLTDGGRPGEGLPWFEKAIRTLTPLHEHDARLVVAKAFLRNSYWGRAIAYERLQKYAEAVKDWDKVIELSAKQDQMAFLLNRLNSLIRAGRSEDAVIATSELTRSTGWSADQWFGFACVYSTASGKVAAKKQEYADRAIELLTKAINAGFKNAAQMKSNNALDPLRDRADFKKLLDGLPNKPTDPPKTH